MIKLIKISGKNRKKHIMLVIELFFSFIALFLVLSFIFRMVDNARAPMNFDYNNVSILNINIPDDGKDSTGAITSGIEEYLVSDNNVEAYGKYYSSIIFGTGYMNPWKDLKVAGKIIPANNVELVGASDNIDKVFKIKLLDGRWFSSEDNASKYRPAVINKKLKELIFGNQDALGQTVEYCENLCTIVGVCNDRYK